LGAITPWSGITELLGTSSTNQHEEIRTGKQHVEPIQILFESFVGNLPVAEVSFHNQGSIARPAKTWYNQDDNSKFVVMNISTAKEHSYDFIKRARI
jgi:hypothetical protein